MEAAASVMVLLRQWAQGKVGDALDELARVDQRKARAVEFCGMFQKEISAALGVSMATVKRDLWLREAFLRRGLLGGVPQ